MTSRFCDNPDTVLHVKKRGTTKWEELRHEKTEEKERPPEKEQKSGWRDKVKEYK